MRGAAGVKPILFFSSFFLFASLAEAFRGGGDSVKSAPVLRGEAHS